MTSTSVDDRQLLSKKKLEKVSKLVMTDRRLSVSLLRLLASLFSTGTVHLILPERLLMNEVSARSVPQMLSDVQ